MADTTQDTNQGCPNIRVCPYMDEKQRAEVEAGKFIRNPITAYVVRPKTVKGIWDLISKCDYNPQGDCSYPRHFTHTLASMELGNQCLQKENLNASSIGSLQGLIRNLSVPSVSDIKGAVTAAIDEKVEDLFSRFLRK